MKIPFGVGSAPRSRAGCSPTCRCNRGCACSTWVAAPAEAVPHNGFDPAQLAALASAAGRVEESTRRVHVAIKGGREYPVFLLVARRAD